MDSFKCKRTPWTRAQLDPCTWQHEPTEFLRDCLECIVYSHKAAHNSLGESGYTILPCEAATHRGTFSFCLGPDLRAPFLHQSCLSVHACMRSYAFEAKSASVHVHMFVSICVCCLCMCVFALFLGVACAVCSLRAVGMFCCDCCVLCIALAALLFLSVLNLFLFAVSCLTCRCNSGCSRV